jgi:ketosteroid isomerase-like protein
MSNLKQLATQYFETFSNKDVDGLAELFADNIIVRDWEINSQGKIDVLATNKSIFDRVDTITVTPLALYEDGNTVSAEIEVLINNDLKLLVVDVITFENNKISSLRAYKG